MEADLSDFEAEGGGGGDEPCAIARLLESLDEQRRVNLQAALDKPAPNPNIKLKWAFSHERVAKTVRGWGFKTSTCQVGRHRRGVCSCPR